MQLVLRCSCFCIALFAIVGMAIAHSSSYPFIAGNTFREIADHVLEDPKIPFAVDQVHDGDIIFLKTDYVPYFFQKIHPYITARYILITHNADVSPIYLTAANIPWKGHDFSAYLDDPHIIVWFSHNIDFVHPKLKPLPLGIANNHFQHGNTDVVKKVQANMILLPDKKPSLYINYNVTTNTKERKMAYEWCKQLSCSVVVRKRKPFFAYLEDINQHRFTLSPFGNSKDCHRIWEALLLGSIPVMKHSLLDPLFDGLPVILIDDWSEVTQQLLTTKYQEIIASSYKHERMYADYWIHMIKSYQNV